MTRHLSHEEVHNLPDFQAIEKCIEQHHDGIRSVLGDEAGSDKAKFDEELEVYGAWVQRHVADLAAIEHMGDHRMMDLGPDSGVPFFVGVIGKPLMIALWKDAFIAGALFQKARTEELTSLSIPDTLEGLA
jgi:hypothetical protein